MPGHASRAHRVSSACWPEHAHEVSVRSAYCGEWKKELAPIVVNAE